MTQINFNATTVVPESADRYKPVPPGEYPCMIEAEAVKQTKDGYGAYLELGLRVTEGIYQGRVIYDRLNLKNTNPKAVEIGKARLSAICHAVNMLQLLDTNQLVGQRLVAVVRLERDKNTGQLTDKNIVVAYDKLAPALNAFGQPFVTPSAMDGVPGLAGISDDVPF